MAENQWLPAPAPGEYNVIEENRWLKDNTTNLDDLSKYIKDFPWLKGIKLTSKTSSFKQTTPQTNELLAECTGTVTAAKSHDSSSLAWRTNSDLIKASVDDRPTFPVNNVARLDGTTDLDGSKDENLNSSMQPTTCMHTQDTFSKPNTSTTACLPRFCSIGRQESETEGIISKLQHAGSLPGLTTCHSDGKREGGPTTVHEVSCPMHLGGHIHDFQDAPRAQTAIPAFKESCPDSTARQSNAHASTRALTLGRQSLEHIATRDTQPLQGGQHLGPQGLTHAQNNSCPSLRHDQNIICLVDTSTRSPRAHPTSKTIKHGDLHEEQSHFLLDSIGQGPRLSNPAGQDHHVPIYHTRNAPLNSYIPDHKPSYANVVCPPKPPQAVAAPTKKGDYFVVAIDDALYHRQIEKCKQSFIGKISYSLGDKPFPFLNLKNRLKTLWKTNDEFRMVPLGKGYYNISFDSFEDRKQAGARSKWAISPGIIRLSPWTPGFNPYKINSSKAQVWLRIYELPFEFWHPSIIMGIAKAVGSPIKIDDRSLDGSVGHYVRVLVEVDLTAPLHLEVMVDGPEYCDLVHLQLENLPPFCPNCKMVGHSITNCNKINRKDEAPETAHPKSTVVNNSRKSPQRARGRGRQQYRSRTVHKAVEKPDENETTRDPSQPTFVTEIVTSNTFDALAEPELNPKEGVNDELLNQNAIEKTQEKYSIQAEEVNHSNSAGILAPDCSALVTVVQTIPKSILKKPSKGVLGARSWADMAEHSLDTQLEVAQNPFQPNGEESLRIAETQNEFKFSSSTQAIVDLVRSKAAAKFSVKHPSTPAAQAMRSMVTKKWSSGNGG